MSDKLAKVLVAIPSTFQGISSIALNGELCYEEMCRNPFNFSGHFKEDNPEVDSKENGRNPFNFSGHFKTVKLPLHNHTLQVAIPSTFQGISSLSERRRLKKSGIKSQSLQLFRAFQVKSEDEIFAWVLSQSLQLFRAFQEVFDMVEIIELLKSQSLQLFRAFQELPIKTH